MQMSQAGQARKTRLAGLAAAIDDRQAQSMPSVLSDGYEGWYAERSAHWESRGDAYQDEYAAKPFDMSDTFSGAVAPYRYGDATVAPFGYGGAAAGPTGLMARPAVAPYSHGGAAADPAAGPAVRPAAEPGLAPERGGQRVRVYADGVFDLFHPGHVAFLKRARAAGGPHAELLVGVITDRDAQWKRRPVMTHAERVEMVRHCTEVDAVVADPPLVLTAEFLTANGIDFVVHGDDDLQEGFYRVPREQGKMLYVPYTRGVSTTELIARAKQVGRAPEGVPTGALRRDTGAAKDGPAAVYRSGTAARPPTGSAGAGGARTDAPPGDSARAAAASEAPASASETPADGSTEASAPAPAPPGV
jgi:cytidyltransferase-like protein